MTPAKHELKQETEVSVDCLQMAMQGAFKVVCALTLAGLIPFTYYGYVYN